MNRRPSKSRSEYDSFLAKKTRGFSAAQPGSDFFEKKKRRSLSSLLLSGFACALAVLIAANFAANFFVHVRRVSVPIRGLNEAFEGYTILHLSDLKGARFGREQALFDFALSGKEFDLVVLTGDMVSSLGGTQAFLEMIERIREINPDAPMYMIPGDSDPVPASMDYAPGGTPFASWVTQAQQLGAKLLSYPISVERDGLRIWLSASSQLTVDIDNMQRQFEAQYAAALSSGDESAVDLAVYNLGWLEGTRQARAQMTAQDVYIALTHVLPAREDTDVLYPKDLPRAIDLMLGGHYLGGLMRIPGVGPLFVPSSQLPLYGILADGHYSGLERRGSTWVYANPGLGSADEIYPAWFFRLMNPPSATLITLTPSSL